MFFFFIKKLSKLRDFLWVARLFDIFYVQNKFQTTKELGRALKDTLWPSISEILYGSRPFKGHPILKGISKLLYW